MENRTRRIYIFLLLFSLITLLFYERNKIIYYDNLVLSYIKAFLINNPRFAPLFFILIYIGLGLLLLPVFPLTILGGALFGGFYGTVYVLISCSSIIALSYIISRFLAGRSFFKKIEENTFYIKIREKVNTEKFQIMFITRLVPTFPFGIQNYIYGALEVKFFSYWLLSTILTGIITIPYTTGIGIILDQNISFKEKLLYILGLIVIIFLFNFLIRYIKKHYEES